MLRVDGPLGMLFRVLVWSPIAILVIVFALMFLLSVSGSRHARKSIETFEITGQVLDRDLNPEVGASVYVVPSRYPSASSFEEEVERFGSLQRLYKPVVKDVHALDTGGCEQLELAMVRIALGESSMFDPEFFAMRDDWGAFSKRRDFLTLSKENQERVKQKFWERLRQYSIAFPVLSPVEQKRYEDQFFGRINDPAAREMWHMQQATTDSHGEYFLRLTQGSYLLVADKGSTVWFEPVVVSGKERSVLAHPCDPLAN